MRVLITGGTGFVGSHVARELLACDHGVVCFDLSPTLARVADLHENVSLVQGDVAEPDALAAAMRQHNVTHVVHLAYFLPEAAIVDTPAKAIRINCEGTTNVFEAARLAGIRKVVYASTDGICPLGPHEDDPVRPTSLYGQMKHFNEVIGKHYTHHFGLDTVGLRFGANFGPGGRHLAGEVGRQYGSALVHHILERMMLGKTATTDQDPKTTYTWQYVRDNARCIRMALEASKTARRVFDLAGDRVSLGDMTDIVERIVPGARVAYEPTENKANLVLIDPAFEPDPAVAREEFGYERTYTLESGLREHATEVRRLPDFYADASTTDV